MKTIAITIEPEKLEQLDQLGKVEGRNRSEVVREAVSEYISSWWRMQEEEKERKVFRRLRKKLEQQALALLREQAEP